MSMFLLATAAQGFVILFDEFFFHRKRGLPRWERIGHPVDSFTVLICLLFLAFTERTHTNEMIYVGLALASCLCVTKDEWVHRKLCGAEEMWLHSVLFILHPLVLFTGMAEWEDSRSLILGAAGGVFVFMVYQITYWNFVAVLAFKAKQQAHYAQARREDLYEYFGE
jgi:Ni/Fe-hydrogenase subunit HybB-like protein